MSSTTSLFPFAAGTVRSQTHARLLAGLRGDLQDLQRQLASGKRSETYGGLGDKRVSSLTFRSQTGVAEGYKSIVELTDIRLQVMTKRTDELSKTIDGARSTLLRTRGSGGYPELTSAKQQVQAAFEQVVTTLNAQHEGLFLFSGRSRDTRPVADANTLMFGDGSNAGLRQVIDERRQADEGTTGLGRMVLSMPTVTSVRLAEDAVGNPFGIKHIAGSVGGSMSNVTVIGPAGAPPQLDVALTGQPQAGERISFTVRLPDGQTRSLGFSVATAGTSDDTIFQLGATVADTANNLNAAISSRLTALAQGELRSASAVQAARDFFSGSNTTQPPRVAGPPFNTSTAPAPVGSRPTVIWYTGDDDTLVSARDTQRAEIADGSSVGTGARANETAFKDSLIALGLFLAEDYPPNVTSTKDRFDAAAGRAIDILNTTGGPGALLEVNADFGRSTSQVREAKTRHEDQMLFLNGLLSEIENVKNEEVAIAMTSLQTRLEASYQATATLSRLSLVNFL
ncbi:FlgL Flagellin and related hook-associated proteins [Rhabdaerophilaceae bacterium]